jgi:hypothetical protein
MAEGVVGEALQLNLEAREVVVVGVGADRTNSH